jgi:hypothetical protein
MRHFKDFYRTIFDAVFAGITFVRIDIDEINFVVPQYLCHNCIPVFGSRRGLPYVREENKFEYRISKPETNPNI